ncbi:CBS domain-containing protein [Nocardioides sp. TF02-7]|uniref:CBS domain-containing protein n=1 Tax=Nocardioides sp. TF02-7 TaxID=2917724 RepID=UPI001F05A33E|nr:CBS domain-containing protein [Nocardioides sp. TF02-7]UMG91899.1 CBS domain-containing protein [Nocardioides sp. TF02-7]
MTPHAVTVRPDTDLVTAIDLATSTGIKSIPVVDEHDRVVGVISRRDVVRMLARSDAELEHDIDDLLVSAGFRDWLVDVHDGVAEVSGPTDPRDRALARVVARGVPGVVEVHVDPNP